VLDLYIFPSINNNAQSLEPIMRRFKIVHFDKKFNFHAAKQQQASSAVDDDDDAFYRAATLPPMTRSPALLPHVAAKGAYDASFDPPSDDDDEESVDLCSQGSTATVVYEQAAPAQPLHDIVDLTLSDDEDGFDCTSADWDAYCLHCDSLDMPKEELDEFGPDDFYEDGCALLR
jgi:hypothetical protein